MSERPGKRHNAAELRLFGEFEFKSGVNRAAVAQWIEHLSSEQRVGGSNPSSRTTSNKARFPAHLPTDRCACPHSPGFPLVHGTAQRVQPLLPGRLGGIPHNKRRGGPGRTTPFGAFAPNLLEGYFAPLGLVTLPDGLVAANTTFSFGVTNACTKPAIARRIRMAPMM